MNDLSTSTQPKPFIFVLMPFAQEFDDIYKFGIKGAALDVGAYAERLDEQVFSEGMLDRIFNQISKADVVVADMTGRNANVFYEVGYAHALGKIVLLLTKVSEDIPFDLKHRQHTVYGGSIDVLRAALRAQLEWAIAEARRKRGGVNGERVSIRIGNQSIAEVGSSHNDPIIDGTTDGPTFSLPFQIRNDSAVTTLNISHVYLFTPTDPTIVPYELHESNDLFSSFLVRQTGPMLFPRRLLPFTAEAIDAPDGLAAQFRLGLSFQDMPPRTVEAESIDLMMVGDSLRAESAFRLRLHSASQVFDFPFRVEVTRSEKPKTSLEK
jgi:hypothetical protein